MPAHNLLKCNNLMHNGLTWGHCMNQQPWSKPLVIVGLPAEPHTYDELETVTQVAVNRPDSDIIIDFSRIEHLDRRSMLSLVVLHRSQGLPNARFMSRVLGSVGLRMLALFLIVVAILLLTKVDAFAFGVAFIAGVIVTIALEMWFLLRWAPPSG